MSNQFPTKKSRPKKKYLYNLVDRFGVILVLNAPYPVVISGQKKRIGIYTNIVKGAEL